MKREGFTVAASLSDPWNAGNTHVSKLPLDARWIATYSCVVLSPNLIVYLLPLSRLWIPSIQGNCLHKSLPCPPAFERLLSNLLQDSLSFS